ncbi:MAG: DUF6364 family protein [Cyclobacteriaceae bacterium]
MTTKLTLTVEKKIIDRAKQYAQKTGRSLSDLVESYLDNITSTEAEPVNELPEDIKKLFGSVKIPLGLNHKKEIRKILANRKK